MTGLPVPKAYPACDSYALYESEKFPEARACAIQERLALLARLPSTPSAPQPAGGLVVLTELYANAEGVPRNPALASRFFCEAISTGEVESDSSETPNILAVLARIKKPTRTAPSLIFCDLDNGFVPPQGVPLTRYCEEKGEELHAAVHAGGIQEGIDDAQEDADQSDELIKPILAKFSPAQLTAYNRAAEASKRFIAAQVTGDLLFGRYGLYPNEMHAAFENLVVGFVQRPPTAPSAAEFASADADLNTVYRNLVADCTFINGGLNPDNLRTEERAWIAYRDAMVALGKALAPSLPASAWLLPLTTARTSDLKQIIRRC
jgi:hypothetical protein